MILIGPREKKGWEAGIFIQFVHAAKVKLTYKHSGGINETATSIHAPGLEATVCPYKSINVENKLKVA